MVLKLPRCTAQIWVQSSFDVLGLLRVARHVGLQVASSPSVPKYKVIYEAVWPPVDQLTPALSPRGCAESLLRLLFSSIGKVCKVASRYYCLNQGLCFAIGAVVGIPEACGLLDRHRVTLERERVSVQPPHLWSAADNMRVSAYLSVLSHMNHITSLYNVIMPWRCAVGSLERPWSTLPLAMPRLSSVKKHSFHHHSVAGYYPFRAVSVILSIEGSYSSCHNRSIPYVVWSNEL